MKTTKLKKPIKPAAPKFKTEAAKIKASGRFVSLEDVLNGLPAGIDRRNVIIADYKEANLQILQPDDKLEKKYLADCAKYEEDLRLFNLEETKRKKAEIDKKIADLNKQLGSI